MIEDPSQSQHAISAPLSATGHRQIFAYFGTLMLVMAACDPNSGLTDIPISFILKNTIHLDASQVSQFRLIAAAPLYVSFLFGIARDRWSPFGLGDRGHFIMFGLLSAFTFLAFALIPPTLLTLFIGVLLVTCWSLFIASAQNGLASTIGEQHSMTGQMSTVWNTFTAVPAMLSFLVGGQISQMLSASDAQTATRSIFLIGAAMSLALAAFGLFRPSAVYDNVKQERPISAGIWTNLAQIVQNRSSRNALLIWFLWNFAPGTATPLQFYFQDVLGSSAIQWGRWNAIFTISFVPTFLLFGFLCTRLAPQKLLCWGTIVAVPQYFPLLMVHSLDAVWMSAVAIGLMGGLATAAYVDLIMRSAPHGLQGTMMMSASAAYFISTRVGDVVGSAIYDHLGGFFVCVAMSTAVYLLILVLVLCTRVKLERSIPA